MKGIRTGIDFSKHEMIITVNEHLSMCDLKKPDTISDRLMYINVQGICAVTGDYGNWMLCRTFFPNAKGYVSEGYWKEKMTIASTQKTTEYDADATEAKIREYLDLSAKALEDGEDGEDGDLLTDEEVEYLEGGLSLVNDQFDYEYHAHRENCGRFSDHESVPHETRTPYGLKVIFDGFDEMCRRMKFSNEITDVK